MTKDGLFRLLYGDGPAHFFIDNTTPCGIDGVKRQRFNEWIEVDPAFPLAKICLDCMEYVGVETPEPIKIEPMKGGQENG